MAVRIPSHRERCGEQSAAVAPAIFCPCRRPGGRYPHAPALRRMAPDLLHRRGLVLTFRHHMREHMPFLRIAERLVVEVRDEVVLAWLS